MPVISARKLSPFYYTLIGTNRPTCQKALSDFFNLPRTQAAGADPNFFHHATEFNFYSLQVRFPAPFRHIVGMADVRTNHTNFSTNFAMLCQLNSLVHFIIRLRRIRTDYRLTKYFPMSRTILTQPKA